MLSYNVRGVARQVPDSAKCDAFPGNRQTAVLRVWSNACPAGPADARRAGPANR